MSSSMSSPLPKTPMSEFGGTHSEFSRVPRSYTGTTSGLVPRRPPKKEKRIWGLKAQTFYILLAIAFFLMVLATATGLGVGLALGRNTNSTAADSTPSINSTTHSSISPTRTTLAAATNTLITFTGSIPVATPTGVVTEAPIICPGANGTEYVSVQRKLFEVRCGIDYNKSNGAVDQVPIENVLSFAACLDLCATIQDCIGAGYGKINGIYTCWPKSKLGTSHQSNDWVFALYREPQPPS